MVCLSMQYFFMCGANKLHSWNIAFILCSEHEQPMQTYLHTWRVNIVTKKIKEEKIIQNGYVGIMLILVF